MFQLHTYFLSEAWSAAPIP